MPEPTEELKPGYKTTEFWLTAIAELVGLLLASGVLVAGSMIAKIVGGAIAVLAALGYTVARSKLK